MKYLSYPQKNEKIDAFDKNSKYVIRIIVPTDACEAFNRYSNDFYIAAHIIASYLLETDLTDISKLDTYFFLIAFLYRHSIELKLKAVAFQSINNKNERRTFVKDTFHNLEEMLKGTEAIKVSTRSDKEMQ